MDVLQTAPLLRVFDVARAEAFYVDYLGCTLDWTHRFDDRAPAYLQVSRGALVLHLTEHHGDCSPGATVVVRVDGLDGFHRELAARDHPFMRPSIETMPWRERVMQVTDPFGNRLRFSEAI